jgi:hypothetical protein
MIPSTIVGSGASSNVGTTKDCFQPTGQKIRQNILANG